jgi:hypothetical protein
MLLKLFAGSILGLGLLLPGVAAEQKPLDCCAANLACCRANLPCCQSAAKAGCCAKGQKCCAEGMACCTVAHQTSAKRVASLTGAKACSCCAMKTTPKAGVQVADCCTAKLACCATKSACCSAKAKPACCQAGKKCCAENKACCTAQK